MNGVGVNFTEEVKYLGVSVNTSMKDDNDIHSQNKSVCCAAKKLTGTFAQCSTAVKNTLFHT